MFGKLLWNLSMEEKGVNMNTYQKLKAVQGLIVSLDEQIFRQEQFKKITRESEEQTVAQYFNAVREILDKE